MGLDLGRVLAGMGILIGLYLFGRFGDSFDQLFGSLFRFTEHQTAVLQGNIPFRVYQPSPNPSASQRYQTVYDTYLHPDVIGV